MIKKIISAIFFLISIIIFSFYTSTLFHIFLSGTSIREFSIPFGFQSIMKNEGHLYLFLSILSIIIIATFFFFTLNTFIKIKAKTIKVTNKIIIPEPAGENQYGSARFMKIMDGAKDYAFAKTYFSRKDYKEVLSVVKNTTNLIKADMKENESEEDDDENINEEDKKAKIDAKNENLERVAYLYAQSLISKDEYIKEISKYKINVKVKKDDDIVKNKLKEVIKKRDDLISRIKNCEISDEAELLEKIEENKTKYEEIDTLIMEGLIKESSVELHILVKENEMYKQIVEDIHNMESLKSELDTVLFLLNAYENQGNSIADIEKEIEEDSKPNDVALEVKKDKIPILQKDYGKDIKLFERGGAIVGFEKLFLKEKYYYIREDAHLIVRGSTRIGKTRGLVLQSIAFTALAGESVNIIDMKGEIFGYTVIFLLSLRYKVYTLDFKNPLKSNRYNFLDGIINAFKRNAINEAIDLTWDIVSQLVGEAKGEKLWTNGEASIIAASILAVVYDNMDNYEYQNLTNVYYFIAFMTKTIEDPEKGPWTPLSKYMSNKPDTHPAKGLFAIAEVAPERTRGSFYTSALTTLRLFTNPLIYDMTCRSDFNPSDMGKEKSMLFFIVPDERSTYYPIVTLFATQQYIDLSKFADENGGRLPVRVKNKYDEFGNFPKIPRFSTNMSVGAGKGLGYELFLQADSQLDDVYGKETATSIKGNCEFGVFLNSDNEDTVINMSKKLDKYTIASYSGSTSAKGDGTNSYNLTGRDLMMVSDFQKLERPYALVTSRKNPAIMKIPDISKWYFNKLFGMGSEKHNQKVLMERKSIRTTREIEEMQLWGVWNKYLKPNISYSSNNKSKSKSNPVGNGSRLFDEISNKYK